MTRAKTILDAVFPSQKQFEVHLKFYTHKKTKKPHKELQRCGFILPDKYEMFCEVNDDEWYDGEYIQTLVFKDAITSSNIHAVLWAKFAKDCGVKPTADFETYFIDYDSAIIAWPYDYRGLDLVANDKKSLQEYYHSFNDWILDYDRAKIDDTFK